MRMTKAKLVPSWRRAWRALFSWACLWLLCWTLGLSSQEPTGVRASCIHTTCAGSRAVQNSVFSMYFLRISSFEFIARRAAPHREEGSTPRKASLTDLQCPQLIPLLERPTHSNLVPEHRSLHMIKESGFSYRT